MSQSDAVHRAAGGSWSHVARVDKSDARPLGWQSGGHPRVHPSLPHRENPMIFYRFIRCERHCQLSFIPAILLRGVFSIESVPTRLSTESRLAKNAILVRLRRMVSICYSVEATDAWILIFFLFGEDPLSMLESRSDVESIECVSLWGNC